MESTTPLEKHLGINLAIESQVNKTILVIGLLLIVLSLAVMYGWIADIESLKRILLNRVSMKFNTALGLFFLGLAIASLAKAKLASQNFINQLGRFSAAIAALIGVATGAEYLFAINLGFDQFFMNERMPGSSIIPGRMSPTSALCFVLLGLTFSYHGSSSKNESFAQVTCFITLLLVYGILIGYLVASPQLSGPERLNVMAIHTAFAFLLISAAGLCFYHDHRYIAVILSPTPAGFTARRLLPIIFFGPLLFLWLRWTFISEDWLDRKMSTSSLTAIAVGFTSLIANILAWKVHEQYSFRKEQDIKIEEQDQLLAWREKIVSSLVHDLRTPMTAARFAAELFTRKRDISPERIQVFGERIIVAIDRSDRLLRDLLDSTKAMTGILPHLPLNQCDLRDIVNKTLSVLPYRKDRIHMKASGSLEGMWNEDAILRIIENLVTNAFKYGDQDKVVTVEVSSLDSETASIKVHNWGSVIPEDEQEGLFDLFNRRLDTIGRPGWGIGLVTVKALADNLGGKVSIKSSLNEGTEFLVELPKNLYSDSYSENLPHENQTPPLHSHDH